MKKILIVLIVLTYGQMGFSQEYFSNISRYTTKDGLSSNMVYSIHKDESGFIWIGTNNGLNRFDGSKFILYTPENTEGMTFSKIHKIFEDDDANLWLFKERDNYESGNNILEVNLMNIYSGEVVTLQDKFGAGLPFKIEEVSFVKELRDGQIYFYSKKRGRIFKYSSSSGFSSFPLLDHIDQIIDMEMQSDGNYLVNVHKSYPVVKWEMLLLDSLGAEIASRESDLSITYTDKDRIKSVQFDGSNFFTNGFNLDAYAKYSPDLRAGVHTDKNSQHVNQTSWNRRKDLLWMIHREHLKVLDTNKKVVYEQSENFDDNATPIMFDGKITWLSNKRDGLMSIELIPNHFTNYRFFEQAFDNSTRGIYKDNKGVLWVSTVNGTAKVQPSGAILKREKKANVFTNYQEGLNGNLWFFDENVLIRHNIESGKEDEYPLNVGFETWSLLEKDSIHIWFTGHQGVLYQLNHRSGALSSRARIPSIASENIHVYDYVKKDSSHFWLCTDQGLYEMYSNGKTLSIYSNSQEEKQYIPAKSIHDMLIDSDTIYWVATGHSGLLKLKYSEEQFEVLKSFTTKDGMPSNSLHSVYEDDYNYLWISSDNGLIQFDKETERIYSYFEEEGIPNNEFNRIAHHQAKDGKLFFGGLEGVTSFDPKSFAQTRTQKLESPLIITSFQQFSGADEKFIDRTNEIIQSHSILLKPSDQLFVLKVSVLDYSSRRKKAYEYRIKEVFDWEASPSGSLNISGLPYGNHILEIRTSSDSQVKAAKEISVEIFVEKPFYLKLWFAVMLFILFCLISYWFLIRKKKIEHPIKKDTANTQNKVLSGEMQQKIDRGESDYLPVQTESPNDDMEERVWLEQVERIALREVKNPSFTIDDLAQELLVSRSQLFRKIKKHLDLTPKKYLNLVRLNMARNILEKEEVLTLTEVSYAVGFENASYFAKLYEAEFGQRPHNLLKK